MLYADKKHLETETARDVLRVREKEMRYYARNLSMLATQSALLAGFAFTILSQYTFKFPYQGVLSCARRADLMMSLDERCDPLRGGNPELPGMSGWTWDTWLHQFGQLLNLTCTTYAMALQLWTLTRCVLTNILGLGLALRGPEGSMDRAVRHMARRERRSRSTSSPTVRRRRLPPCHRRRRPTTHHLTRRAIPAGIKIFFGAIIISSLNDYAIYVSATTVFVTAWTLRKMLRGTTELVRTFWLDADSMVTGQFNSRDEQREALANRRARKQLRRGTTSADCMPSSPSHAPGLQALGDVMQGRYRKKEVPHIATPTLAERIEGAMERMSLRKGSVPTPGAAAARAPRRARNVGTLNMGSGSALGIFEETSGVDSDGTAAPTDVVRQLIKVSQVPASERGGGKARSPSSPSAPGRRAA